MGDGAETLAQDAGISKEEAYALMAEQEYGTYVDKNDGNTKSAVDVGDVVDVNSQEVAETKAEIASNEQTMEKNKGKMDSLNKQGDLKMLERDAFFELSKEAGGDSKSAGWRLGSGIKAGQKEVAAKKDYSEASKLKNKNDSLRKVNEKLAK